MGRCASARARVPLARRWRELCKARWECWPHYRLTDARERWLDVELPLEHARPPRWPCRVKAVEAPSPLGWLGRYRWVELDALRTRLIDEDLTRQCWYFNFSPSAGGRGRATLARATFGSDGWLSVPNYPPLPYALADLQVVMQDDYEANVMLDNMVVEQAANQPGGDADAGAYHELQDEELDQLLGDGGDNGGGGGAPRGRRTRQALLINNFPPHYIRRLPKSREWVVANDNVTFVSCAEGELPAFDERGFLTDLSGPDAPAHQGEGGAPGVGDDGSGDEAGGGGAGPANGQGH